MASGTTRLVLLAFLVSGCSLAPPLKTPDVASGAAFRESGPWTQAEPADRLQRDLRKDLEGCDISKILALCDLCGLDPRAAGRRWY